MIAAEPAASWRFMRVSRWGIPELRAPARTLVARALRPPPVLLLSSSELESVDKGRWPPQRLRVGDRKIADHASGALAKAARRY